MILVLCGERRRGKAQARPLDGFARGSHVGPRCAAANRPREPMSVRIEASRLSVRAPHNPPSTAPEGPHIAASRYGRITRRRLNPPVSEQTAHGLAEPLSSRPPTGRGRHAQELLLSRSATRRTCRDSPPMHASLVYPPSALETRLRPILPKQPGPEFTLPTPALVSIPASAETALAMHESRCASRRAVSEPRVYRRWLGTAAHPRCEMN